MNPIKPTFDAALIHKDGRQEAVPSNPANLPHFSKLRATKIRSIFRLPDLQAVIVSPGVFDFDNRPLELPPIEIYAPFGPELTTWKSSWHDGDNANNGNDGPQGPCFKGPATGVCTATGIHFQGPGYGPDGLWQQTVVGWIGDKTPGTQAAPSGAKLKLRDFKIDDGTFPLAIWAGYGNTIEAEDGFIGTARWGATNGGSGGDDSGFLKMNRVSITVNTRLSNHRGNQGYRGVAVACRGGTTELNDCVFNLIGDERMEVAAGVWTARTNTPADTNDYEAASPYTKVRVTNSFCSINANGAKDYADLYVRAGEMTDRLNRGTMPDGAVLRKADFSGRFA